MGRVEFQKKINWMIRDAIYWGNNSVRQADCAE